MKIRNNNNIPIKLPPENIGERKKIKLKRDVLLWEIKRGLRKKEINKLTIIKQRNKKNGLVT